MAKEKKSTENIVSNPAQEHFTEGRLIKIVENISSQFGGEQCLLIVKTKKGLNKYYVSQKFWDALSEKPRLQDEIMLTIETRIIGQTTYMKDGEIAIFGADAPDDAEGSKSERITSIDSLDTVQANSRKKASGNIEAFLGLSDDDLNRLGAAGLSIS